MAKGKEKEVRSSRVNAAARSAADEPRTRKNLRLSQAKIYRAKAALGTQTDAETIELALDLAVFGARVASGIGATKGFRWRELPEGGPA